MKYLIFLFLPAILGAQTVVYTYNLDTFANRVDSFYLEETATGRLVSTGDLSAIDPGERGQSITNPIFFSDTAALTAFWQNLKQDSINLAAKIGGLQKQADLLGKKYRAIWYLSDSVFHGYTGGPKSVALPPELLLQQAEEQPDPAPEPTAKPKKQKATTRKKGGKKQ